MVEVRKGKEKEEEKINKKIVVPLYLNIYLRAGVCVTPNKGVSAVTVRALANSPASWGIVGGGMWRKCNSCGKDLRNKLLVVVRLKI